MNILKTILKTENQVEGVLSKAGETTYVMLRVGTGLLFVQHGLQKMFGKLNGFQGKPGAKAPLKSLMGLAGIIELTGGACVAAGFLTRPVAAVATGEMISAYRIAHAPKGGAPIQNAGELALLYALAFAYIAANGAGKWSLDRRIETALAA